MNRSERVGITTTVPLEPFLASGSVPVDLNNAFIGSPDPSSLVEDAQAQGYPRNICTWIKGLYAASPSVDSVVGVVRGDCSNTESLLETLRLKGVRTHPFSYPASKDRTALEDEMAALCDFLGCTMEEAASAHKDVVEHRRLAWRIDDLLSEGKVRAHDAHLALVSTSDLSSDPASWRRMATELIERGEKEAPASDGPRLGYIGVPPIITDLYERIEAMGGRTVFMEVQRQFSMPFPGVNWIGTYLRYTYPYSIEDRIADIRTEVGDRRIDGIVHYVQSFCHRQIDDMIFRSELGVPVLTVEGNIPGPMDERTAIRLEAFLDVLARSEGARKV